MELTSYDPRIILDLAVILSVALFSAAMAQKFRLPSVVGMLVAGIILGPFTPGFTVKSMEISTLGQIGSILILFVIGLQFEYTYFKKVGVKAFLLAGTASALTFVAGSVLGPFMGLGLTESLLLGVIFISSSTTISLKLLEEVVKPKNQKEDALTKAAIVIEDLYGFAALAFVLAYLQTGAVSTNISIVIEAVLASVAMLAMLFFLGVRIMPRMFYLIERHFPGSAFSFGIAFCLFLSYAVISLNVSPLIGAFLAGTILTSTMKHKDVLQSIIPIRNLFATLFFVSIGMLIDPGLLISMLPVAIIVSVVAILSKALPFIFMLMRFGVRQRDAIPLGVITGPRGEISLVIAQTAIFSGLAGQHFLAISTGLVLLTAIISPLFLLSIVRLKSFKGLLGV